MKSLLKKNTQKRQFFLFLLTGGFAAIVNVLSRMGLSFFLKFELAVLIAYGIGMITAYLLAKKFVFLTPQKSNKRSFAAFTLVNLIAVIQTWLVSMGIRIWLLQVLSTITLVDLIAHCFGVAVPIFTSFYGHKYISFREPM
tara:strand:+ start:24051 stop:24473 length:423 start_codon:yes stop_codon:yes gene_type:complete